VKLATLSEEVKRRLRNTSLEVDHSSRPEILERIGMKFAVCSSEGNKCLQRTDTEKSTGNLQSRFPTCDCDVEQEQHQHHCGFSAKLETTEGKGRQDGRADWVQDKVPGGRKIEGCFQKDIDLWQ
jgi:hypothetical protein